MLTVVSYGVMDDRRRLDLDQLDLLARRLSKVIDETSDSVRIHRIRQECAPKTVVL